MPIAQWSPSPNFQANMVASAEAQVNALVRNVWFLASLYAMPQPPFCSLKLTNPPNGNIFMGALRHKPGMNYFIARVRVYDSGVNEIKVSVPRSPQTFVTKKKVDGDWTFSATPTDVIITQVISGASVDEEWYSEVFVQIDSDTAQVMDCYETKTTFMPTLPAFASGTPTVDDWQRLSARADLLYDILTTGIRSAYPSVHYISGVRGGEGETSESRGFLYRRGTRMNYSLAFRIDTKETVTIDFMVRPYPMTSGSWTTLERRGYTSITIEPLNATNTVITTGQAIFGEGQKVMTSWGEVVEMGTLSGNTYSGCVRNPDKFPVGENNAPQAGYIWARHYRVGERRDDNEEDKETWAYYNEDIDLLAGSSSAYTAGQMYELHVQRTHQREHSDDGYGEVRVEFVNEGPAYDPTLAFGSGWDPSMDIISKDDAVSAAVMKPIRDNLAKLSTLIGMVETVRPYHNRVATNLMGQPKAGRDGDGWFVRGHMRWLIYYLGYDEEHDKPECKLTFVRGKVETGEYRLETMDLEIEPYKWMAFDLESILGLAPGMSYKVHGVTYAFEDMEPVDA